ALKRLLWFILLNHLKNVDSFFINKIHILHLPKIKNNNIQVNKKYYIHKSIIVKNKILYLKKCELEDVSYFASDESGTSILVDSNDKKENIEKKTVKVVNKTKNNISNNNNKKKKKKKSSNLLKCKTCNKVLKPRVKFCVYCGTNVSVEKIKFKRYIEEIYLPLRKEEVSDNTYRVEKGFWKDILPRLGKYELHELGANNWESFLKYLKSKNCSPRTMALYQSTYQ
ncbi:tyrosine recombinase, putative, partial [Hepatocystis sp. ex Piliocolobus tephrosceles]